MDLINRWDAIDALTEENLFKHMDTVNDGGQENRSAIRIIKCLLSVQPTLREKALLLLLDWAIECGFGYDNIPEEYAMYEKNIENMDYKEGLIYIAERELERNERYDI